MSRKSIEVQGSLLVGYTHAQTSLHPEYKQKKKLMWIPHPFLIKCLSFNLRLKWSHFMIKTKEILSGQYKRQVECHRLQQQSSLASKFK